MSMILGLTTVSDKTIDRVLDAPFLIWRVIAPDDPEAFDDALAEWNKPGFFARLIGRKKVISPSLLELELSEGEGVATDLDKSWHGLHFLFTGTDWKGDPPLNFIVAGGVELKGIDVGYGPPRIFRASEVSTISKALAALSEKELRGRFDPAAMKQLNIYPEIWDRDPEDDDTLGYLLEYFETLKKFMKDAVERGFGLIVTLG